ncbi:MAG TPA: M23 family metallopeptidase [Pyrinomonadaceae bacterium]|nr:M23 family metallopeptidase [Pyrinomonadaceae bacterium]
MKRILAVTLLVMCASALAPAQRGDANRRKLEQRNKGAGAPGANDARKPSLIADAFTPVVASVLGPPTFFVRGTDGKYHVAYDVEFQNTRRAPAKLLQVQVVDEGNRLIVSLSGNELVRRLRTLDARPVRDARIEPNGGRVLFIELTFDSLDQAPKLVRHRLALMGAGSPADVSPSRLEYMILPYDVAATGPFTIGPPLAGKGWAAVNGCCAPGFPHRSSFLPLNGMLINGQRFAIDWMRLNDGGYFVVGDPSRNENWANYGADILAVADATVIETLDELDDNKPGALPDPRTINVKNVDGNHIVLDFGNGLYGFYAHLKRGSQKVRVGDKVRKGDKLALLGNTGNSSAPHLHFHIMDGPSVLGSSGVPYLIESFEYDGLIPVALFDKSEDLTEKFGVGRLAMPKPRKREYPLAWAIINFP